MQRGDVIRVQLPRPVGRAGREQFGTRPAIVVQESTATANLSTVIIVPLTSNRSAERLDGSLLVQPSDTNGLTVISVALTQQNRAFDKSRVEAVIGRLSSEVMKEVDAALQRLLSL